jgi:hypothetical protein
MATRKRKPTAPVVPLNPGDPVPAKMIRKGAWCELPGKKSPAEDRLAKVVERSERGAIRVRRYTTYYGIGWVNHEWIGPDTPVRARPDVTSWPEGHDKRRKRKPKARKRQTY